jgi:uncharacterized membrane protein YkvA (DUF1232 family)
MREMPALIRSTPSMFRDLIQGRYRQPPLGTLIGAILSVVYLINPLDLVPDVLPVLGIIDDTLVAGVFLALLSRDVKKYVAWRSSHENSNSLPKKT